MKNPRKVFDYSKLTFSQIVNLEDLYAKFTKGGMMAKGKF